MSTKPALPGRVGAVIILRMSNAIPITIPAIPNTGPK
jgi:hypothetical protein